MAPEHVEVVVAPRSFDRSTPGAITGPIWLRHGRRGERRADFPEAGWTDFPVRILGGWLDDLAGLAGGAVAEAPCHFMDGPYEFTVADAGRSLLRLRCARRDLDELALVAEFDTPAAAFFDALRSAATAALAECERRGWTDRDVDDLRRALASFGPSRSSLTGR